MKCPHCGTEKKPSQRLMEELAGALWPCKNKQEGDRDIWLIEKLGIVLDEMFQELKK